MIWKRARLDHLLIQYPNTWSLPAAATTPNSVWPSNFLTMLWAIWDTRNALIFRDVIVTSSSSISHVIADLSLWLHRLKNPTHKEHAMVWQDQFSACNSEP
jgi:hypothetical protein